jgi:hypothetical protein
MQPHWGMHGACICQLTRAFPCAPVDAGAGVGAGAPWQSAPLAAGGPASAGGHPSGDYVAVRTYSAGDLGSNNNDEVDAVEPGACQPVCGWGGRCASVSEGGGASRCRRVKGAPCSWLVRRASVPFSTRMLVLVAH